MTDTPEGGAHAPPDWGLDEDPAPFWSGGGGHPVDSDDPIDLPEVRAAMQQGWEAASEAPLWCFVPAVWPTAHRAWVRDLRIRHASWSSSAGESGVVGWSTWDHAMMETDYNRLLVDCGLPPRPPGRVWLLRVPDRRRTVDDALAAAWASWRATGGEDWLTGAAVHHLSERIRSLVGSDR